MAKFKLPVSLLVLTGVCFLAATGFAKPAPKPKCGFNGDYSFYFWDPDDIVAGVGYVTVALNSSTSCRAGTVVPGGIINCNVDGTEYEDFVEDGSVFLETDGEGTMEIETNSSRGICGTGTNAVELDISVVAGGKKMLFNSNGVQYAASGTIPQAGYFGTITGRAERCFPGDISGCFDMRFWEPDEPLVGDCTVCVAGGFVTGGSCRCNTNFGDGGFETLSEIETGGYTLGEDCQSSTGFLTFTVSSDEICGETSFFFLDFAVAQQGNEIMGACDSDNSFDCAFEGWKQ
jgi:hypothetical protein